MRIGTSFCRCRVKSAVLSTALECAGCACIGLWSGCRVCWILLDSVLFAGCPGLSWPMVWVQGVIVLHCSLGAGCDDIGLWFGCRVCRIPLDSDLGARCAGLYWPFVWVQGAIALASGLDAWCDYF